MKRINFQDFAALPAGTIFYHYTDGEFFSGELFRKEETIYNNGIPQDFFETKLFPSVDEARCESIVQYTTSRWALYEYETAEFIVMEPNDIKILIHNLLTKQTPEPFSCRACAGRPNR